MAAESSSEVELPSGNESPVVALETLPDQKRCCQFGCLDLIDENDGLKQRANELQMSLAGETSSTRKTQFQFEVLKQMIQGGLGGRHHRRFKFMEGADLCRNAAATLLHTSGPRITRLVQWIDEGHSNPPVDGRSSRVKSSVDPEAEVGRNCHTMWAWVPGQLIHFSFWMGTGILFKHQHVNN